MRRNKSHADGNSSAGRQSDISGQAHIAREWDAAYWECWCQGPQSQLTGAPPQSQVRPGPVRLERRGTRVVAGYIGAIA